MKRKKPIVIANWKMNPVSFKEAKKLFDEVKKGVTKIQNVQTIIAPPSIYLRDLTSKYKGSRIAFGVQNISPEKKGSYTGEISVPMVKDSGAAYAIVGHSERRAIGETNELVHKKLESALMQGMTVVLCIGESERDHDAQYLTFLKEQLTIALRSIEARFLRKLIIAYEPIWAIGKTENEAMKPHDVHQMVIFIRKILTERYDMKIAQKVPVIYGGSAEPGNAEELLRDGEIDGFLVGHASLDSKDFVEILQIASKS